MTAYYETTLGANTLSAAELDRIAVEKAGIIGSHGYSYGTNGAAPLAGGWAAAWIGTRGMGNYGTLVLRPTDRRTSALWREGQIARIMSFGMSAREAVRVLDARIRHAHETPVLEAVSAMLACDGCVAAARSFDRYDSTRSWCADYADVLPDMAGLSVPRINAAVAAVLAAIGEAS